MKEYDIFIPLNFNDGNPVPIQRLQQLQSELLDRFGGVTFFPQPNDGLWKMAGVTYRDEIVVYRVITAEHSAARTFLTDLKARLKDDLDQEEILIIERDIETL